MLKQAVLVTLVSAAASSGALAGSGNEIYLRQDGTPTKGNVLTVDQSGASNSLVRGTDLSKSPQNDPASQAGGGNMAVIAVTGNGGDVMLQQDSRGGAGNLATIGLAGQDALATVSQIGSANAATLNVTGGLARGSITQNGTGNKAELGVEGLQANGSITQNGNGNTTNLDVVGNGATVSYTLNANNVTTVPGNGVQVFTTAPGVTITQTTLP